MASRNSNTKESGPKSVGGDATDNRADGRISPSQFMRQLRPEYYSDTAGKIGYVLDEPTFSYHLETITSRNDTHDFEMFCRKLCERTICPNLRPQTGPEGGGDSKADTETTPVADELASLTYVGDPSAGKEKWAFAFSAKKNWSAKARSDIKGIAETKRGYSKVFFVTNQFARAKDRARVEDELTREYGIPVTIHDRSWIIAEVIEKDRRDLAFNYLGIGQETAEHRLGPDDYSRTQNLADIEKAVSDPTAYAGMETQLVADALIAAKLSRNLERPRVETDGRFTRARRLAEARGTFRQKIEAHYESIWTAFWYFDDIALMNASYDEFAARVIGSDDASMLERLANLTQLLFNSVQQAYLTEQETRIEERVSALSEPLEELSRDVSRPNNALEAKVSLLTIRLNVAFRAKDPIRMSALWGEFTKVVEEARGLGEFSALRLEKLIGAFGVSAGNDRAYTRLVEQLANFIGERTSDGKAGLMLLKRAQQLDFDQRTEMIRLLGRAARRLAKKEYASELIEALQLLSIAYKGAGLLWAARACCVFAIATIFIESAEDSELRLEIIPTVTLFAWISIQLRHLPDFLMAIQLLRGFESGLPLDEESMEKLGKVIRELDMAQACCFLNVVPEELDALKKAPDILEALGVFSSRTALMYALGYEESLRQDGSIPTEETPASLAQLMTIMASQPVSDDIIGPLVVNEGAQTLVSTIMGVQISVVHSGSVPAISVAEAVLGTLEACWATAFELDIQPHTESFSIVISEQPDLKEPGFTIDADNMRAALAWPEGQPPSSAVVREATRDVLMQMALTVMGWICRISDADKTLASLFEVEAVHDRVTLISYIDSSYNRAFGRNVHRLDDWAVHVKSSYPAKSTRPVIARQRLKVSGTDSGTGASDRGDSGELPIPTNHRNFSVRSVIDVHLWDKADWRGVAFLDYGPGRPPGMAFLFGNESAARKIFERWRERFGETDVQDEIYIAFVRGICSDKPHHYKVLVTSRVEHNEARDGSVMMIAARTNTMRAETGANLGRFLRSHEDTDKYLLLPAIWRDGATPELIVPLGIQKRNLSVKMAADVGQTDLEYMAAHSLEPQAGQTPDSPA